MGKTATKLKKGDQVVILTGRDKGAKGEILRILTKKSRAIVSGVNMIKKHRKPTQLNPQGGIENVEASIHLSNISLADPKTEKPTRVGYKTLKDGKKVRYAKASGETLS